MNRSHNRVFETISALTNTISRESPLTIALVFSRIAAAGPAGIFQNQVQRELDLTPATMTRALQALSEGKTKPGLGLISREMDFARDGRQHLLKLTPKGRELANSAEECCFT
jgi:DNA-binding MarR family transcriptional regulator